MLVWIVYDITRNKPRRHIVKALKKNGIRRIQKSVFLGNIEKSRLDELFLEIKDIIFDSSDSVYFLPVSKDEIENIKTIGEEFDKKIIMDIKNEIIL